MSSSSALPTLMALRQSLRRAYAPSSAIASTSRSSFLHSSALRSYATESEASTSAASTSSSSSTSTTAPAPAAEQQDDGSLSLDSLHAEFGFDPSNPDASALFSQPAFEDEIVAVPSKPSLVHVHLSYLSPATKPLKPTVAASRADVAAATGEPAPAEVPTISVADRIRRPSPRFVPLSSHVFDAPARRDVLHSAVVYYLDAQRSGTASTKTRSDVRGSKRKLRQQKGSGMARLGTMSSPTLRGGAVAHGPRPRDHSTQLPRRVRELALRSALSARWREGNLLVVPSLDWIPAPGSTNPLVRILSAKKWTDVLFLSAPRNPKPSSTALASSPLDRPSSIDPVYTPEQRKEHALHLKNFATACSNIPRVELIELDALTEEARDEAKTEEEKKKPGELHAYEVLKRQKVVCDLGAIEWLEEKLGGAIWHEQATLEGQVIDPDAVLEQQLRMQQEDEDNEAIAAAAAAAAPTPSSAPTPAASA